MSDISIMGDVAPVGPTVTTSPTDPIVVTTPADPAPVDPPATLSPMQVAVGDLTKIVGDESATSACEKALALAVAEEAAAQSVLDAAKAKTLDARAILDAAIAQENADVDTAVTDVGKLKHG